MVGSIDPRCETVRGTHWPVKVAGVFGTRVAENHLGQRSSDRINRPDIWMQAIRSDQKKLLWHGGRPHMGPCVRRDDERGFSFQTATPSLRPSNFRYAFALAALAPEALVLSSAQERAWGMPDARCTRSLVCTW